MQKEKEYHKEPEKLLAYLLVLTLLGQLVIGALPTFADSIVVKDLTGHSFHEEVLWLTEIYPNDVDRSKEKDTRAADGCYTVTTYNNTSDHMEFLELMSTHNEDFKFNDVYSLYYNSKELTVTDLNGGSDITVKKGQPIVIWNERLDVSGTRPDAAISFEGAFSINYFFTPAYAPVGDITMYYWYEADFDAADVLTVENASGSVVMQAEGDGQYRADIEGIAARKLADAVYVAAVYSDGTTTWTSGVLGYSIGAYCASLSTKGGTIADLAMATAVYGYHAKAYFG